MRRMLALIFAMCCLLPQSVAYGAEYFLPMEGNASTKGIWSYSSDQTWRYILQESIALTDSQARSAEDAGVYIEGFQLSPGSALTTKQLESIFPNANDLFGVPKSKPTLELFELTGKWFYGNDDKLYYQHDENSIILSKEEVFSQLHPDSTPPTTINKTIYLTIDDAPTSYTMDLLSVLEELDVKATFFVVGSYVRAHPVFLRAIYDQGHVIANHSYTHNEATLKSSFSACLAEFTSTEAQVNKALGFVLPMPMIRIPYGSGILTKDYLTRLQQAGYYWIDWNALNGDTEKNIQSDEAALDRAISTASRCDGSIVMLVHDGKKRTIRILPELVAYFREQGYEFRVLDTNVPKIPGVRSGLPQS